MACFLASSACRGSRPKHIVLKDKHVREHLISKLMSSRSVLRFINAPNGFGKSVLAAQYADLVFSFKDVFWINCKSPCFIRDLDSEDIFKQILQLNEKVKLVVFDNLEELNDDRLEKFSALIDSLLDFNCEVLVTSSNYKDNLVKAQPDCLLLKSQDLLLTEAEVNMHFKDKEFDSVDEINRIPIVAWKKNGIQILLSKSLNNLMTDAIIFSLFYIYLFSSGNLKDLKEYIPKSSYKLLLEISNQYVYFGINEEYETFNVPDISIQALINIFSNNRILLFSYFKVSDKFEFVSEVFSKFKECGNYLKAIEIVRTWGNKNLKTKCLEFYNENSIRDMFMIETSVLYESLTPAKKDTGLNSVFHALRLAILGFKNDAIRLSYSILDSNYSTIDNKLFAALIFMRFGEIEEKNQAIKIIRFLNNDFKIENFLKNSELDESEKTKCRVIKKVVDTYLAIYSETINPFEKWLQDVDDDLKIEDIISAECIFNSVGVIRAEHIKGKKFLDYIGKIARYYNYGTKRDLNFYTFALVKAYLQSAEEMEEYAGVLPWDISNDLVNNFDKLNHQLNVDKNQFTKIHKGSYNNLDNINLDKLKKSSQVFVDYKSLINSNLVLDQDVPKLFIKVFGGLSAYIGGKEIIERNFGRQKIKLMCCVLAIEDGQEVGKEKIASLIWPESDEEQQRINMNTHWSVFKKLLTLRNGSCPYLIRNQNSYKFNKNFFDSDLHIFENLCSDLTMGPLDSIAWFERISEYPNILNGDLLPSESNNKYILNKRIEYKNMLISALIAASERLLEAGEVQQSLWFANKAISRDATREDCYVCLMKAQMMAGQRTPAIETYMACEKFLESDLGIRPSNQIREMYDRLKSEISV